MSFAGVGTAVVSVRAGALVSMVNEVTANGVEALPAVSVTVTVQSLYVPSVRVLKVIRLAPDAATVVVLEQLPPYIIVPASSVLKV